MKSLTQKIKENDVVQKERKVFLGGTCAETTWREELIPLLEIPYFNPVVEDWTSECQAEEDRQKEICEYQTYVITSAMQGCFSIAEAVDGSNKNPQGTIFCILDLENFDEKQQKSLKACEKLISKNGAHVVNSLVEIANILNNTEI